MSRAVTESALRAIAARALADHDRAGVIAVAAPPHWDGPEEVETDEGSVEVRPCVSVLALRELLAGLEPNGERRVLVLTSLPEKELGEEVLARLWRHRIHQPSGWEAAMDLFRVDRMDPALGDHRWLVDLLVEVAPVRGYPPPKGAFLDLDTAWRSLFHFGLRLETDQPSSEELLRWGESDTARSVLRGRLGESAEAVASRLARTAGPVAHHVVRLARAGRGEDLVPLGLLCDALWDDRLEEDARVTTARVRLEGPVGDRGLTGSVARAWGEAAVDLVQRAHAVSDDSALQRWVARAEAILVGELDAAELAFASDVLPTSFQQRMERAGRVLRAALDEDDGDRVGEVRKAVEEVRAHLRAHDGEDADRSARLQMAERLVRWLDAGDSDQEVGDLADAARRFVREGAWVDRAREAVGQGETITALAEAYDEILRRVDALRGERDRAFAGELARWSAVEPSKRAPLLPIERVLDEVVVPLARDQPALLLVLDGWSHPEASRLAEDLRKIGWVRRGPEEGEHPIVVAALPSVTSVSRASLLSGRLAHGSQADERRHWSEHEGLIGVSKGKPPRLFHRRHLGTSEGHIALEVRDAIHDPDVRVVGAVVNALDEHLDKGGQLRLADGLQGIRPLRPLLDAALEAGRVVILASDHGHVLETGSKVALHGGSGERWRPNHPPHSQDEVEIVGPRVLMDEGSIIVPSTERLRYMAAEKRGYHGGATPQEVLCPLMMLAPPGMALPGWEPMDVLPPAWWVLRSGMTTVAEWGLEAREAGRSPGPTPTPAIDPDGQGQLFGVPAASAEPARPVLPTWLEALLESPILEGQRDAAGRQSLGDEDLSAFLVALDAAGGVAPVQALAQALELPMTRVLSKLAALRRMLNVDGYAVVTMEGDRTVRFDRERLVHQFRLDA